MVQMLVHASPILLVAILVILFVVYIGLSVYLPIVARTAAAFASRWFSPVLLFTTGAFKAIQLREAYLSGKSNDWEFPALMAATFLVASFTDGAKAYHSRDKPHRDRVAELVDYLAMEVAKHTDDKTLRVNLMVVKGNSLEVVVASYKQRQHILWDIGQGVCGIAAERKVATVHDLMFLADAHRFEDLVNTDNGGTPFRMSKAHWEASKGIGSVFSFPIFRLMKGSQVIAVLNLDSQQNKDKAGFSTDYVTTVVETISGQIREHLFKTTWV